jgi:hypothetical protein
MIVGIGLTLRDALATIVKRILDIVERSPPTKRTFPRYYDVRFGPLLNNRTHDLIDSEEVESLGIQLGLLRSYPELEIGPTFGADNRTERRSLSPHGYQSMMWHRE